MRASVDVLGALSARFGRARVAMPGGCNIGARQIDLHLKGLAQMGADLQVSHGFVEVESNGLTGSNICLEFASVGATENLLMAACMAKGPSILENVAREPEIADLAVFLNEMGARIEGIGSSTLTVEGVPALSGAEHTVMGDRIEAGTYLIAGAATGGAVRVEGVDPSTLEMLSMKMREAGCDVESGEEGAGWMKASSGGRPIGIEISTLPYPGFATDLQPQMLALLSIGEGTSFITENIFDNRFMVVDELNRLGADITTKGHHAIVRGVEALSSAPVTSTDLRAGAALCIAGMLADGATEVYEIQHVDRGYERFEEKLGSLGAKIHREPVGA
jgi:UDP-N-acetylglucosamine 1-carboxyvinyltransferase